MRLIGVGLQQEMLYDFFLRNQELESVHCTIISDRIAAVYWHSIES